MLSVCLTTMTCSLFVMMAVSPSAGEKIQYMISNSESRIMKRGVLEQPEVTPIRKKRNANYRYGFSNEEITRIVDAHNTGRQNVNPTATNMVPLVSVRLSSPAIAMSLQWRHKGRDGVSNHQPHHCLLSCLFRRRSKKTPKLRVTSPCAGNSPVTGEFPAQMASGAENVPIQWRHHGDNVFIRCVCGCQFVTMFARTT